MKKYFVALGVVTILLGGIVSFSGGDALAIKDLPNQHSVPDSF
jgi:hypothetical protein